MKLFVALVFGLITLITFDRDELIGKWRFSKIEPGDGTVLDLEALGGVGAEWSFNDDGTVFNHAEESRGKWSITDKMLVVQFGEKVNAKKWSIVSIDEKGMVLTRKLKDDRTSTEHLIRVKAD